LGLLRAAGVESVPGSEIIDRIPEALSRSSAPTGELGVLERLIPSEEGDAEDVTPEPPEASQPETKPLPAETSRATADSLDQI
jgi:hypothetical protein